MPRLKESERITTLVVEVAIPGSTRVGQKQRLQNVHLETNRSPRYMVFFLLETK